jgi:putative addiction module component (TIGR02574 family)
MDKLQKVLPKPISVREKINLVQNLWDEITAEQVFVEMPIEHSKILDERLQSIENGNANFVSWNEIKNKYKKI